MTDIRAVCWEAISCLSGRAKGCGNVCKKVFGKPEVVEEEPFDGHFQFSKFQHTVPFTSGSPVERFSIQCRETKTKVFTLAKQKQI